MSFLKKFCLILSLVPVFSLAQTMPMDHDHIAYENKFKVADASRGELYKRAKETLADAGLCRYAHPCLLADNKELGKIEATGVIKIKSAPYKKYQILYHLHMQVKDGEYRYRIDSLVIQRVKRYEHKAKNLIPEEMLKDINNSDKLAVDTEHELNQMDVYVQKLIALIRNSMGGQSDEDVAEETRK